MNHVWLVVYSHRAGTDVYVFCYEASAVSFAQEIALTEPSEMIDRNAEPKWNNWSELTGGEENIEVIKAEIK